MIGAARPVTSRPAAYKLFAHGEQRHQARVTAFAGLETFAAVVERRSFTAAARQLGLSKSFVSETVKHLEDTLGVRLLDRTTRSVSPTEAGQLVYARAARALQEAQSARSEVQQLQRKPVGRLRVAVFEAFHRFGVLAGLTAFIEANPALQLELIEGAGVVDLVKEGIDLAIRVTPQPGRGLIVRRLGTSRVVIVAAPAYLARAGVPRQPAELAGMRVAAFAPLFYAREWRFMKSGQPLVIPVRPALLAHNTETLRAAARAGVGVTALPLWMVSDLLGSGELVQLLPDHPLPESGVYAVYPSNRLMTPKVRLFVEQLVRFLPPSILDAAPRSSA